MTMRPGSSSASPPSRPLDSGDAGPSGLRDHPADMRRRAQRGALEAQQKRYMDDRFGRDRAMNRKRRG